MVHKMSRLGIFVFYDPQGIVDGYVRYLLSALRPNLDRLVVISNTELDASNRILLEQCCDALCVRENHGLDAAAFKEALTSFCGWEAVRQYDEVVLCNDTFFGPIHSFDTMFEEMAQKDVDFWGMAAGYPSLNGERRVKYGYVPDHIQTFFAVFRKSILCSPAFFDYWTNYDDSMDEYLAVVTEHELVMTKHFQDLGFRWDIYADTKCYRSEVKSENFNLYLNHAYRMMKDMRFPAFKKKVLCLNIPEYLYMNDLEEPAMAMEHIRNCTDYDIDLIWENVIRVYDPSDLYNSLHLNYVLPSYPVQVDALPHCALVSHITNPDFARQFCIHAEQLADWIAVYLLPEGEAVEKIVNEHLAKDSKVVVLKPTGQDTEMGGFLLGCKELAQQYTFLGFIHDLQNPDHHPATVCESTVFGYLQNIANDKDYIAQILERFESDPRLGILGAPFPIHHHGFGVYGNQWGDFYGAAQKLSSELDLHCTMTEEKPPIMLTGAFWSRTAALKPLWEKDWKLSHFRRDPLSKISQSNEALKRILPFVSQSEGYYSGIVMHTNYASMRITSQQYMLDAIIPPIRQRHGCYSEHFLGFHKQLQAASAENSGGYTQVSLRGMVRVWLEKHLPKQLVNKVMGVYRFFKRSIQ